MQFRIIITLLGLLASVAVRAEPAREFHLDNGMKIIVKEDHRSPTAVHMVWYKAGSMDEFNGTTGIAHVLEHMMFKGTKKVGPGEFSRRVAALGGRENAFTSKDYTAYYQQIDSGKLEDVIVLESDRMANLALTEKEFVPELKVVMEERRWRIDDRATGLLAEAVHAVAYTAHPYRRPIIGWMRDLQQMTVKDAMDWYRSWYAPNNAVVVVAGDVDTKRVLALAKKYYGKIPARAIPVTRKQDDPPQRGIRRVSVKAPAENPVVTLAFKVPTLRDVEKDVDVYALDVLESVLDGHENARLNARLVRADRIANAVSADYTAIGRGPSLFVLGATPARGIGTRELEQRLRAEVDRIARNGVTEQEMRRVKTRLIASQIYKRDSVFGQAMEIGTMEMSGLRYKDIDRIVAHLNAVTSEQVQAVAKKYFGDDALTIATLIPLPITERKAAPGTLRHGQ